MFEGVQQGGKLLLLTNQLLLFLFGLLCVLGILVVLSGGRELSDLYFELLDFCSDDGDLPLHLFALAAFAAVDGKQLIVLFFAD